MRGILAGLMCAWAMQTLAQGPVTADAAAGAPVTIRVELQKSVGAYKPIYSWFGYDEANYTTMPRGRELLREL